MLDRLAIAILLAIVLPVYGQKESPQPGGNKADRNGSESPSATPLGTATCEVKQEGTAIECHWPEAEPKSYFKRLISPENAPNIGLFFVGLGGVFAAAVTLWQIKRQADLTQRQIDLMVAKERAKIAIFIDYEDFITPSEWGSQEFPELAQSFSISIENQGITRAYNVRGFGSVMVTDSPFCPPMKEAEYLGDCPRVIKGESDRFPINLKVGHNKRFPTLSDVQDIRNEKRHMHLFGYIMFDDAFGIERIKRFRWLWNVYEDIIEDQFCDFSLFLELPGYQDSESQQETIPGSS